MNNSRNRFPGLKEELKNQEYDLKRINDKEILIRGVPTITTFMFFVLILVGTALLIVGILSFSLEEPELISGILFTLVGLFLIALPIYNYYSKRGFGIYINAAIGEIVIKTISILPSSQVIKFDDINRLILRESVTNAFVDDTSKSSTIKNYSVLLDLNHSKPALIRFIRKDDKTEEFVDYFFNQLGELMNKKTDKIVVE